MVREADIVAVLAFPGPLGHVVDGEHDGAIARLLGAPNQDVVELAVLEEVELEPQWTVAASQLPRW